MESFEKTESAVAPQDSPESNHMSEDETAMPEKKALLEAPVTEKKSLFETATETASIACSTWAAALIFSRTAGNDVSNDDAENNESTIVSNADEELTKEVNDAPVPINSTTKAEEDSGLVVVSESDTLGKLQDDDQSPALGNEAIGETNETSVTLESQDNNHDIHVPALWRDAVDFSIEVREEDATEAISENMRVDDERDNVASIGSVRQVDTDLSNGSTIGTLPLRELIEVECFPSCTSQEEDEVPVTTDKEQTDTSVAPTGLCATTVEMNEDGEVEVVAPIKEDSIMVAAPPGDAEASTSPETIATTSTKKTVRSSFRGALKKLAPKPKQRNPLLNGKSSSTAGVMIKAASKPAKEKTTTRRTPKIFKSFTKSGNQSKKVSPL